MSAATATLHAPRPTVHGARTDLAALVEAARDGDEGAWAALVDRLEPLLRHVVRGYRLSRADVEDVLQSTWLRLFEHLHQLRDPGAAGAWLATTARRECLRLLQTPLREVLTDDPELGGECPQDGPESVVLAAERSAILDRALSTLPERHRRLMTLLASESATDYVAIGGELAMPVGSIGPTRARCLARLARHPELIALRADVCISRRARCAPL
jgi:RNA polymerase sigma factor (sigma-70 family)